MFEVNERLEKYLHQNPRIGNSVYIAQGAIVIGDVFLDDHASIWFNAVLRGDLNKIKVGKFSNIQDNSVVHLANELGCYVGDYVTVGHNAIIHGCTIGNACLIGMGATILDGAVIGDGCLVGAQSLITVNSKIPEGSMVMGVPAKVVRQLTQAERDKIKITAEKYAEMAAHYLKHQIGVSAPVMIASNIGKQ